MSSIVPDIGPAFLCLRRGYPLSSAFFFLLISNETASDFVQKDHISYCVFNFTRTSKICQGIGKFVFLFTEPDF